MPAHLFDANICYPERDTLAFSEPLIVPALMGAPLAWLGASPVLVYNVVLILGFALTAWAGLAVFWGVATPLFVTGVGGCGYNVRTGQEIACTSTDMADLAGVGLMLTVLVFLLLVVPKFFYRGTRTGLRIVNDIVEGAQSQW